MDIFKMSKIDFPFRLLEKISKENIERRESPPKPKGITCNYFVTIYRNKINK